MNSFIPSTKDLLSFVRPQSLNSTQQQLVRDKIGIDDSLDDWVVTWDSIENGTLPVDRLPSFVARRDQANTFSAPNTFFDVGGGSCRIDGRYLTFPGTDGHISSAGKINIEDGFSVDGDICNFSGNRWHRGGNNQRFYFAFDSTTYIQGHGSQPIVFRNASDVDIASISNTGNLTVRGATATSYGYQISDTAVATPRWLTYKNDGDPTLYLRDLTNSRMHVAYTPGASAAAATTNILSNLSVEAAIDSGGRIRSPRFVLPNSEGLFNDAGAKLVAGSNGTNPWNFLTDTNAALGIKVGSLVISDNYSDAPPTSGLYIKGSAYHVGAIVFPSSLVSWGVGQIHTQDYDLQLAGHSGISLRWNQGNVGGMGTEFGRLSATHSTLSSNLTIGGGLNVTGPGTGSGNIQSVKGAGDGTAHLRLVRSGWQGWSINQAGAGLEVREDGTSFDAMQFVSGGNVNFGRIVQVNGFATSASTPSQIANGEIRLGGNAGYQARIEYDGANQANLRFTNTWSTANEAQGGFDFFNGAGSLVARIGPTGQIKTTNFYIGQTQTHLNFPGDGNNYLGNITHFRAGSGTGSGTTINGTTGAATFGGRVSSNVEYRLGGNSYSRVAQMDAAGQWGGGYNFNLNSSTPQRDSTGTVSAIRFNQDQVELFAEASGSPGAIAPRYTFNSTGFGFSDSRFERPVVGSTAMRTWETSLSAWQEPWRGQASATGARIAFLGATPIVRQSLPAAATDAATTQTLANALRSLAINFGLAN